MRFTRFFAAILLCAGCALAQDSAVHSSMVTVGAGAAGPHQVGPVFRVNYEYRWTRHLALEAGLDFMILRINNFGYAPILNQQSVTEPGGSTYNILTQTGNFVLTPFSERQAPTILPFGFNGILPVRNGRVELFGGVGAAYTLKTFYGYDKRWLAQASLGARVSLDRRRRFWLGTTWRGFTTFQSSYVTGNNVFSGTFDFGYRFGK